MRKMFEICKQEIENEKTKVKEQNEDETFEEKNNNEYNDGASIWAYFTTEN